jgi:hypothetical protein
VLFFEHQPHLLAVKERFYISIYNIYIIGIKKRVYSTVTLCPNCKAIGALLLEIFDHEHTDSYVFIYIDKGI